MILDRFKRWIRRRLLNATKPPYECYWRDRALAAEKQLTRIHRDLASKRIAR